MLTVRILRLAVAALAVLSLATLLSGCSLLARAGPARAEHGIDQVQAEVAALPGVLDAQVAGGPDGIPGQNEAHLSARLVADYPGDVDALYRYLVAEVWSCTTLDRPTTKIAVAVKVGDTFLDLTAAAKASGWTANTLENGNGISPGQVAKTLGPFPGPVPTPPAVLTSLVVATPSATASPRPTP